MFCAHCGKEIDDNAAFCGYCGKANSRANNNKAPVPIDSFATKPTPPTFSAPQKVAGVPAAAPEQSNTNVAKEVKTLDRRFLLGGAALIVIIAVIITGFMTNWFGIAHPSVKDSVNDYSWKELSSISSLISNASDESEATEIAKKYNLINKNGKLDGTQTKDVPLSNGVTAQVQIVGFFHDEKADGGKAGITFIFKNGISDQLVNLSNTDNGGWEQSQIRLWLANDGLSMLPQELQENILSVKKDTNNIGQTDSSSSVTTTIDSLWLFSVAELFGTTDFYKGNESTNNAVLNAEGKKYKLFRDSETAMGKDNTILEKKMGGISCAWWTRSPLPSSSNAFCGVNNDGVNSNAAAGDRKYAACPGFSI